MKQAITLRGKILESLPLTKVLKNKLNLKNKSSGKPQWVIHRADDGQDTSSP